MSVASQGGQELTYLALPPATAAAAAADVCLEQAKWPKWSVLLLPAAFA